MKKKLVSICLVVLMLLAMLPTTVFAYDADKRVDHIDVDIRLQATLMIDGTEETVNFPDLTKADVGLVQISGAYSDGTPVDFTRNDNRVTTSTDGEGHSQIRIPGSYPIGTQNNPAKYTVSITKNYTVKGVTIPITLSATVGFWDVANVCPGKDSSKGIDLKLGEGVANCGLITVQKTVAGAELTENKTFQFEVKNATSGAVFQTASVTVPAGGTTAVATVIVPYGDYKVEEVADSAVLGGYKLTTTYQTLGTEKTDGTVSFSAESAKNQTVSVTNTYEAEIEMVELSVRKEWNDGNNRDGIRPASVEVQLLANGEPVEGETVPLSAENNWTHTWENLPEKDSTGATITYSVKEEAVEGYSVSYEGDKIINTHNPGTIEKLVVTKEWDDADDQDGKRPDSVMVQLYANGQKVGEAVELNAEGNWAYAWEGLYQYEGGEEIEYTVEEVEVPDGYVSDVDGLTITNTHMPEITSVYVTKEWDDADDQDEIRPDSVTVRLMKNGEQYQDAVELNAENQWTWSWQELPKYEDGEEIVYTLVEDPVEGYTASYDAKTGVLTNSHTPAEPEPETVDKTVTKVWDDANNQDGIRPDSVKVQLLANGEAVGEPVELTEKGQWTYTWTGLLKYEDGEEIVYTFEEAAVEGYTAAYEGDKIVNTHTPDAVNVTVVKKWVDGDSKDRPTEITVQLYADGEVLGDPVRVTKDGGWSYVWKNLPANADGKAITYTVKELNVPAAYNATYSKDTLTITNTLKDIPKSGDSANLWLYGGIMVVCAAAVVVLLLTKKKRGEA